MRVRVRLFSVLRRYAPGGEETAAVELPAGARVADALAALAIPPEIERVVLVNGQHAPDEAALADGDEVTLFPPVAGG
ncbi:MAG: MoaD/ThiS family protein [Deferrisomatales bacterium]